jgi:uncharacterized protein
MQTLFKNFWFSIVATVIGLLAMYYFGALEAVFLTALLIVLEVTLSFDNAVVNARVLKRMSPPWQQAFLTWGMLIAVFGTRFVLPIFIVSLVALTSPITVLHLALFSPADYAHLLESSQHAIHAFGATFLVMVSLKYFLDEKKEVHWIHVLEKHLTKWGRIESVEIATALVLLVVMAFLVPAHDAATVLIAGIVGLVLFIAMEGVTSAFSIEAKDAAAHGLALFIYLNVLDSAFSLDGVVGAFALTSVIPIIAVGLGIGALFVRSLTVYMVRRRTLEALTYLEHGAHWAIFGLAVSMFVSLIAEVPEVVTGTIGIAFVAAAYWSSVRLRD